MQFPATFLALCAVGPAGPSLADNPIVDNVGLTDPHVAIFGDRAYVYATHDFSPQNAGFVMKDWWAWSSADLVHWRLECTLKPEDTFLKRPFNDCWATFCVHKNKKYYWYFSAGPEEIGVVVADSPSGPWKDPLGKPLLPKGLTPTEQRDPDILMDDDGKAYMVFGTFDYFIVRLGDDMISLAEKPRPVTLDRKFGPYGEGQTDDKPSLHKRNGVYYLSWSSFYAMSTSVYGPYAYKGSVISPDLVAPEFRIKNLWNDRHGNFFTWHNQWYYACNDKSGPGRTDVYRDAVISYVHYRDNGELAPIRLDRVGVGQYDARAGRIEAEDFFDLRGGEVRESVEGGFEVRGLRNGSTLLYPNIENLSRDAVLSLRAACGNPNGATIEVHADGPRGKLLGRCKVASSGGWTTFATTDCPLRNGAGKGGVCLVFKGGAGELLRLDWLSFRAAL